MSTLRRILAVLDGSNADVGVLTKAVALAHRHGAALELFLCDAEHAFALQRAYDPTGIEEFRREHLRRARRYLESVRDIAVGADVRILVDAACESPLYQGIVRKVLRSGAELVIKHATGDTNDWQLMRTCPAALWLSRGRPWSPVPKFAVALDVSAHEMTELPRAILRTSALLAHGCHAESDILYSQPEQASSPDKDSLARLQDLVREVELDERRIHILGGEAEQTLPAFAANRGYDALIMGALTHRPALATLVGTLTARLVEKLDCDFVLVKPPGFRTPVESNLMPSREDPLPKRRPTAQASLPLGFVSPWELPARRGS